MPGSGNAHTARGGTPPETVQNSTKTYGLCNDSLLVPFRMRNYSRQRPDSYHQIHVHGGSPRFRNPSSLSLFNLTRDLSLVFQLRPGLHLSDTVRSRNASVDTGIRARSPPRQEGTRDT